MRKLIYELKSVIKPNICGDILIDDYGAFGIKLTYKVSYYRVWFILSGKEVFRLFPYKTTRKIYLRPLKSFWSENRGRLPKNKWGRKTQPLCSEIFWWEVKGEYGYIKPPLLVEEVKDHTLIQRLRAATLKDKAAIKRLSFNPHEFIIFVNQSKLK